MLTQVDELGLGEPRVCSLEQASPPYWNRSLYCFELQPHYNQEEITAILRAAFEATLTGLPILKAQLVPAEDNEQKGKHDLAPGGIKELFVKNFASTDLDYDDLRTKQFPISSFEDDKFWATPCFPSPGEKIPVFVAQANFIKGGLLLGISFWHLVMDGVALSIALRVFAQNCRRIQDPDSPDKVDFNFPSENFDKSRFHESPPQYEGLLSDHPECVLATEVPTGPPEFMITPLKVEVFHISSTAIKALKVAATPIAEDESHTREPMWVSTNDAITALIWRSIMIATYEGSEYADEPMSCCQIAVNGRSKMNPPLPADYFGCALTFSTNDLPISSIMTAESLPVMALMVRQSIMKVTGTYLESLIAMMRKAPDFRRLAARCFGDLLGRSTCMTSWAAFPLYEYDWGPALGGKCERVRAPKLGMFNGLQTVLPVLPERLGGGYEVMIGLRPHVMEKLKMDRVWSEFCRSIEA